MQEVYNRLSDIRYRVEEESFSAIYGFFLEKWLSVTKENYNTALEQLGMIENNSYCKYVLFVRKYLSKKKEWKY